MPDGMCLVLKNRHPLQGKEVIAVAHTEVRVRIKPIVPLGTDRRTCTLNGDKLLVVSRETSSSATRRRLSPLNIPGSSAQIPIAVVDIATVNSIHRALLEQGLTVPIRVSSIALKGGPECPLGWTYEEGGRLNALAGAARSELGASQGLVIKAYVGASGTKFTEGEGAYRWDVSIERFGAGLICGRAAYVHAESSLPVTEDNCIQAAMSMLPGGAVSLNQSKSSGQGLRGSGSGCVYMAVGLVLE